MAAWIAVAQDVVRRLHELSVKKSPTHNKPMITKPEKHILSSDIRIHRSEISVRCDERAWLEGLQIIKADITTAVKPIITPEGIELNNQTVAFGNINSMFKYFGVRPNAQILKDYTFYTAKLQERDVFVVSGPITRRAEHDIDEKEEGCNFPGLLFGRSWHGNPINVHEDPLSDDDKMIPTISATNSHYQHHLLSRGHFHLHVSALYHPDAQ